jgi:hypothetical protein
VRKSSSTSGKNASCIELMHVRWTRVKWRMLAL